MCKNGHFWQNQIANAGLPWNMDKNLITTYISNLTILKPQGILETYCQIKVARVVQEVIWYKIVVWKMTDEYIT